MTCLLFAGGRLSLWKLRELQSPQGIKAEEGGWVAFLQEATNRLRFSNNKHSECLANKVLTALRGQYCPERVGL